jgi:predicted PurR-regulated permease PerM
VIVAAFVGPPQLVGALLLFIVYQQLENYVIAPRVMKRAVDMSPAGVIVALLIGGSLAGFVGALLSLPVAAVVKIVVRELYVSDRIEEVREADEQSSATPSTRSPGRRWRRSRAEVPSAELEPTEEDATP